MKGTHATDGGQSRFLREEKKLNAGCHTSFLSNFERVVKLPHDTNAVSRFYA